MNKNIKKIIAREGLVIFIIVLIGVSCFSLTKITEKFLLLPHYRVELSNGKKYVVGLNNPDDLPASEEEVKEYALILIKEENFPPNVTIKSLKLTRGKNEGYLKMKLQIQKIRTFNSYFLLLAYPIYLLIRFIIWAIRTLRE